MWSFKKKKPTWLESVLQFHTRAGHPVNPFPKVPVISTDYRILVQNVHADCDILVKRILQHVEEVHINATNHVPQIQCKSTDHDLALVFEELEEFLYTLLIPESPEALVHELCDLIYVLLGFAAKNGIDLDWYMPHLCEANLRKLQDHQTRVDGKVLKPPTWTPVNFAQLVQKQKPLYKKIGK